MTLIDSRKFLRAITLVLARRPPTAQSSTFPTHRCVPSVGCVRANMPPRLTHAEVGHYEAEGWVIPAVSLTDSETR